MLFFNCFKYVELNNFYKFLINCSNSNWLLHFFSSLYKKYELRNNKINYYEKY